MKTFLAIIVTVFLAASAFGQQSLGDIARQNRDKKKPTPAVSLNDDNMPRKALIQPDAASAGQSADKEAKEEDKSSAPDKDDNDKDAKADKKSDLLKNIDSQKDEISHLQRELDIAQREQKLRAAAYYGDAGTMLRDSAKYTEESKKQQEQIDSKKQALDAAQQKLSDLQEQARKAGVKSE